MPFVICNFHDPEVPWLSSSRESCVVLMAYSATCKLIGRAAGRSTAPKFKTDSEELFLLCPAVFLVLHAFINFLPTRVLAIMNAASAIWHIVGTFTLIILLLSVAPTHQTGEYVFTTFNSDTSATGVPSPACVPHPLPSLLSCECQTAWGSVTWRRASIGQ